MVLGELLKEASIMAGLTDPFQDLTAEEGAYAFSKINQMIDLWATDRLAIFRSQRAGPFTVSASTQTYTIGAGAVWDVARPLWIDRAGIIYTAGSTPNPELPMHIMTTKEWSQVTVKAITSTLPRSLFYDRTFGTTGFGTIYLYPVPSQASQVVLYIPIAVTEFPLDVDGAPDLTTLISLPPGYRSALVSNLAVILALGIKDIGADIKEQALLTLGNLRSSNLVTHMDALSCDPAVRIGQAEASIPFDWISGGIQ